jgi:cysteine desulfurase
MEPSHVLRAMNVPFTAAGGAVRFSLSRENTDEDIDLVLDVLPRIVANLRGTPASERVPRSDRPDSVAPAR